MLIAIMKVIQLLKKKVRIIFIQEFLRNLKELIPFKNEKLIPSHSFWFSN